MRRHRAISTGCSATSRREACRTDGKQLVLDGVDRYSSSVFDGSTSLIELLRSLAERSVVRCVLAELTFPPTKQLSESAARRMTGDGVGSNSTSHCCSSSYHDESRLSGGRGGPERPMRPLQQRPCPRLKTLRARLSVSGALRRRFSFPCSESFLRAKLSAFASNKTRFESFWAGNPPKNSKLLSKTRLI